MNLPRRFVPLLLAALCMVGLVAALALVGHSPKGTLVIHGKRVAAAFVLTLSNSTATALSGWHEAPQVWSRGKWTTWADSPYRREIFWLVPGASTNLTVPLPQTEEEVRIPFAWGYLKQSGMQRIAPRLHTRLWNLRNTFRHSRSFDGWQDPYGYLPDEYRFYYLTNSGPGGGASRSRPLRSGTNQTSAMVVPAAELQAWELGSDDAIWKRVFVLHSCTLSR